MSNIVGGGLAGVATVAGVPSLIKLGFIILDHVNEVGEALFLRDWDCMKLLQ